MKLGCINLTASVADQFETCMLIYTSLSFNYSGIMIIAPGFIGIIIHNYEYAMKNLDTSINSRTSKSNTYSSDVEFDFD